MMPEWNGADLHGAGHIEKEHDYGAQKPGKFQNLPSKMIAPEFP